MRKYAKACYTAGSSPEIPLLLQARLAKKYGGTPTAPAPGVSFGAPFEGARKPSSPNWLTDMGIGNSGSIERGPATSRDNMCFSPEPTQTEARWCPTARPGLCSRNTCHHTASPHTTREARGTLAWPGCRRTSAGVAGQRPPTAECTSHPKRLRRRLCITRDEQLKRIEPPVNASSGNPGDGSSSKTSFPGRTSPWTSRYHRQLFSVRPLITTNVSTSE